MLGELQQAPFDEGVRVVSERAEQFRLVTTKVLIHLRAPASYLSCQFLSCCRFDGHLVKLIPPCARTQQG